MSHFTYFCHMIHHSFTIKTFLSISNLSILLFLLFDQIPKSRQFKQGKVQFCSWFDFTITYCGEHRVGKRPPDFDNSIQSLFSLISAQQEVDRNMGSRTRFELKTLQVYCFSSHFFHLLKFSEPPKSSIMRLSVKALQPMGRILYQNYSIPTLTLVVSLAFTNTKFIQFTFKFSQSYNFKTIQNFRVQKKIGMFPIYSGHILMLHERTKEK